LKKVGPLKGQHLIEFLYVCKIPSTPTTSGLKILPFKKQQELLMKFENMYYLVNIK